ncbi:hypothetical protein BDV18DRAFT_156603 [Aspergillus unguis]
MDTTAPGLLWATQLRRENVYLVEKMDEYKAILTSATNTIEALRDTVDILTERIRTLEERGPGSDETHGGFRRVEDIIRDEREQGLARSEETHGRVVVLEGENKKLREEMDGASERLKQLGTVHEELVGGTCEIVEKVKGLEMENQKLRQGLSTAAQTIASVKGENAEFKEKVFELQKQVSVQEKQVSRALNWMSMRTMADDRDRRDKRCTPKRPPLRGAKKIGTGAGTAVNTEALFNDQFFLDQIQQDGRSLIGYLYTAAAVRMRCPNIAEEAFVMKFINGLHDKELGNRLKELTRHSGLSWDSVMTFIKGLEDPSDAGKNKKAMRSGSPGKWPATEAKNLPVCKRREIKGRRSIPIVPLDDEDEAFIT